MHLACGDDAEPAHGEIQRGGEDREAIGKPQFEKNSRDSEAPDDAEQRPSPTAVEVDEKERCVGTGDEQIDGAMIENHEGVFYPRGRAAVVESGCGIEANQRDSVNGATDDLPAAAVKDGADGKNGKGQQAAGQPETVSQRVRELFNRDLPRQSPRPGVHTVQLAPVCDGWQHGSIKINFVPGTRWSDQKPGAPVEAGRISGAFTPKRRCANQDWLSDMNPVYR